MAAEPGWLYSWMTVRRLMRHHAAFYPAWDEKYASHLAKRFALRLDQKFGTLSRGQARRTQLVLALAHRPPILLLDEPTDGLDRAIRDELMAIVADHMVESPTTILMSTHHVHEVDSLVDHLGVLHEGHLVVQVDRSRLHQKLRRYRADVPEDWEAPEQLRQLAIRRLGSDREIQWTVWGDEPEVIEQFDLYGAQVRDVSLLTLDEATLCFLKARHSSQLHEEDPPRKAASNRGRG